MHCFAGERDKFKDLPNILETNCTGATVYILSSDFKVCSFQCVTLYLTDLSTERYLYLAFQDLLIAFHLEKE